MYQIGSTCYIEIISTSKIQILDIWMVKRNSILTTHNLIKRWWQLTSICYICFQDEKSIQHFFVQKVGGLYLQISLYSITGMWFLSYNEPAQLTNMTIYTIYIFLYLFYLFYPFEIFIKLSILFYSSKISRTSMRISFFYSLNILLYISLHTHEAYESFCFPSLYIFILIQ
jgi:zinc-binding in reverse transcriptase